MEVYKYRIKRINPSIYWTVPCTGGTDFWPINLSTNCSGLTMYNSTFSQVRGALNGDMNNFPQELTGCSISNPCVILNDTVTMPMFPSPAPYCLDSAAHPYILFAGLNLIQLGVQTFTGESYNDMISIFSLTNSTLSQPLKNQTSANLIPNSVSCFCENPLGTNLNQLPLLLDQDFNDIGHYDIWDGNIGQKDIFSNFVVSSTTSSGYNIKIWNSTDFGYYKSYQDSPYTIDWGDCDCNCPITPCLNSAGQPCCETLQFPNLTNPSDHTYAGVGTRRITITHESPWGPTSTSQAITVPFMSHNNLMATGGIPTSVAPIIGPSGPTGNNSYFGAYPFSPLDGGTNILQYSGMSPIFGGGNNSNCFDVTGNTESLLGAFQSYTNSSTAGLPPGYQMGITVPLMGDVLNPVTNTTVQGVMGEIIAVNAQYTSYTISVGTNTPITLYDFSNGVTLYEAVSCGLDAFAFGAFDCVKCEIGDCTYCETKDEYIDRISLLAESITFNNQMGEWSPSDNYVVGDIVFDSTWGECCCYMAVKDITQSATTTSPWAGIKPTDTFQGVWWFNGQPAEHIWEACSPICESCPDYTSIPCYDPTNSWNAYPTPQGATVGPAGVYVNGSGYTAGQFTLGQYGNCYRALTTGTLPPPTGLTNSSDWDYIGCSSWICPPVSALTASSVSCQLVAGTGSTSTGPCTSIGYTTYEGCTNDFLAGDCCEDRFICADPYSCTPCQPISSAHPDYNDPSALNPLQGPVFDSEIDCNGWCNPDAFSCTTQIGASNNCCIALSCAQDLLTSNPGYYSSVIQPVIAAAGTNPSPFPTMVDYIAATYELWFGPNYNITDCNNGVSGIASACCDYTSWVYNCEEGCIEAFIGDYPTQGDCWAANPQWMGVGVTQCGWDCPVVCEGCVPTYTLANMGYPINMQLQCEMNCSCVTACYICDCTATTASNTNQTCDLYIDPSTGQPGCPHWPPNEGFPLNPGDPLTFLQQTDCMDLCGCEGGIDCFVDLTTGAQLGGCKSYPDLYFMMMDNATWSPGAPVDADGTPTGYTTVEECCLATECCWAVCEQDPAVYDPGYLGQNPSWSPALQGGGGGNYPCWWYGQGVPDDTSDFGGGQPSNCCSPAFIDTNGANTGLAGCFDDNPGHPYCDMVDCVNSLCPAPAPSLEMTCCEVPVESCECACEAFLISQGWSGTLDNSGAYSNFEQYDEWDTVSYGDGNTPECCWICTCPFDPLGLVLGSGVYDCNSGPPDDGDYVPGIPNCWVSCERLPATFAAPPSNTIGDPCGPCSPGGPVLTYSCSTEGCSLSTCIYSPGGFNPSEWQTQHNCYTSSICDTTAFPGYNQCRADCYCADPDPANEISDCTVMQDYLNDIYSPGTGNNGIYNGNYILYPTTYPPVSPGMNFPTWPFDSLATCLTVIASGVDCCDTQQMTYDCDFSCNCPVVNGNPCIGGTGCFPVMTGPPGPFTSLIDCQEWCTWECNSNGAQVCQFIPLSQAATTYSSAGDCNASNVNCECGGVVEEWWCDWAGADAGAYNSIGAQPCQPSSFFVGQGAPYQIMAIGQGMTGPADPTNNYHDAVVLGNNPTGQGFPNLASCQQMCRFCCDCAPPGSGICDLCGDPSVAICNWGDQYCSASTVCSFGPSELSPYLCQQNTNPYPCQAPQTEYCCHAIDGCISFIGAAPNGSDGNPCTTMYGTNAAACASECNFLCGDCVNACECVFYNGILTTNCSPYPFNNMADCQTYVNTITMLDDGGSCCRCYDCFLNSPIVYTAYDSGSWVTLTTPVNPITPTNAAAWVSLTQYNTGDIVTANWDGSECCYVCVWGFNETGGIASDWSVPPYFYYTAYMNDVSVLTPVWPGGGSGSLVWVPCDAGCPSVSVVTWDCIPGIITNTCEYDIFSNLYNIVSPGTVLLNTTDVLDFISDPMGSPYLQTIDVRTIKWPYGGWPVGSPATPCLHNGYPLGVITGIYIDSDMFTVYGISSGPYYSWSSMIASLQSVSVVDSSGSVVSLGNTHSEICEAIWMSIGSIPGSLGKCVSTTVDACLCTQSLCVCQQITGPTGAFSIEADCLALLTNVPCCGTWLCSGPTSCDCTFVPNLLTGFASELDCYTAKNCCEVQLPEYDCEITVPSPMAGIPDLCNCTQTVGGFYTGINALNDCLTDPTTCCSATTLPDRWECNKDCNCIIDPYGQYTTLHDCHTAINSNCCYTGVTTGWECNKDCNCVLTATGPHMTKAICEAQVNDCCYTGVTRYDCVTGTNNLCKCTQNQFGFYPNLYDCENSIPGPINCCDKAVGTCLSCENQVVTYTQGKHYGTNGGLGVSNTTTITLPAVVDRGLWVSGTATYVYLDVVEDPFDGCCYVLLQTTNHSGSNMLAAGSPLLIYSPSIVYNNHINGFFADGTQNSNVSTVGLVQQLYGLWWPCKSDCVTVPIVGFDCDNCPGTCVCVPNNTITAQYQGPGALAACQAVCVAGCDDCVFNLGSYLTGPIDFEGVWSATFGTYNVNDCVVDPVDKCCYCCVEDTAVSLCTPSTPPGMCPQGQTWIPFPVCGCQLPNMTSNSIKESLARYDQPCLPQSCMVGYTWVGMPVCDCVEDGPGGSGVGGCKSIHQPSQNVGVNIGTTAYPVMWMDCNVDVDGGICKGPGGSFEPSCNDCDTYMNVQWGVPLPLTWYANPLWIQHFGPGQCIDDPNAGCCYCCVTSPTGEPTIFGEGWQVEINQTAPCSVYDMNGDGILEYFGSGAPSYPSYHGWVACSSSVGVPCPGLSNMNYECTLQPTWGNPNNLVCLPDPQGSFLDLVSCTNSPCPPPVPPCEQCCKQAKKGGGWNYQYLQPQIIPGFPTDPCDCQYWMGVTWIPTTYADCCVQTPCPPGMYWSQIDCECKTMPNIATPGPQDENSCVQTENCGINHIWDWGVCGCVVDKLTIT